MEHPITELVSGEDLVEHMLWIAAGKPLPDRLVKQQCLPFFGSAIESRVYAEDPIRNFLPSVGPLITYREPQLRTPSGEEDDHDTVRLDTGVYEGGVISTHYDPMIAKLCTHSDTREVAIDLMEKALDEYVVQGLTSNLCFLRSVMRNEKFRSGKYSTKFIPEEYPTGFHGEKLTVDEKKQMLAVATSLYLAVQEAREQEIASPIILVLDDAFEGPAVHVHLHFDEGNLIVRMTPLNAAVSKAPLLSTIDSTSLFCLRLEPVRGLLFPFTIDP